MTDRRGGYRKPSNPAPVSNPRSGNRTDGGAGQPTRVPSGGPYGARQASEDQQAAAPLAGGSTPPATPEEGGPPGGSVPSGSPDLFGPTRRPNESITAGAMPVGPGQPQLTSDELLRILYQKRPSSYLARLLRGR